MQASNIRSLQGMKRHGFSGQPASHGNSLTHRAMGSAGQSQGGGSRVLPGKRMAGRMGGQNCTVKGLEIVEFKGDTGTIIITGAVPGPNNGLIKIRPNKGTLALKEEGGVVVE